jgi:LPXTG-site transpeptidase (sortase) family protein
LIPPNHAGHRALIDAEGNIILPGAEVHEEMPVQAITMEEGRWHTITESFEQPMIPAWAAFDEEEAPAYMAEADEMPEQEIAREWEEPLPRALEPEKANSTTKQLWRNVRSQVYGVTSNVLQESTNQYETSIVESVALSRGIMDALKSGTRRTWHFVTQPVWVPGRNNQPKQYGRGTLFLLDIVRFGGTFASLFVVLFVSLNFQSFWSIAQSYVDPLRQVTNGSLLTSALNQDLAGKLKDLPSLPVAGASNGDLLAYLPPVGPPDNRLVVPKMDINVPIVDPPNSNLINENWKGLEDDIQKGLQDGVVHYPGTAKPGQAGNFFVTGHSSYFPWDPGKFKSVFARLDQLNVGDQYWVYYGGDKHEYVVTEKKTIDPSDVSVLDQPINALTSTLMTCTPVGTALHRLIIIAEEVDQVTQQPLKPGEHGTETMPQLKTATLPI